MRKSIWDWLETEPTKDINKIKAAYAEVAKKYHPAEHPEEFKQLRDSYKLAIELSKKEGAPAYRVISFDTGDESFKFNLDSSKEEDKEFKFDFGRNKEEDKDLKYDFRDADEAANRTKLDFSSVSAMEVLSKRQKKMLDLLEVMLSYAKLEPEIFGNAELMKAITFNWNRPPYKQEMTPAFVSALVDILKKSPLLDIGAYEVIEKLIWRGGENPELEAFHMQFRSVKNERSNVVHKEVKITKEQIEGCFYKLVNGSTPRLYFEPSSKIQGLFKKKFQVVLLNDMLLFVGNRIRYYFCEDLSYDIRRIDNQLKIYDYEKRLILSVPDINTNYRLIVDHLNKNSSSYLGEIKSGETVFIRKADNIFKIRTPILNKRNINLKKAITLLLIGIIGSVIGLFAGSAGNGIVNALLYIIKGIGGASWLLSILFFVLYLGAFMNDAIGSLKRTRVGAELQNDIKKGKAFFVVGSGMYIFDRYIVYLTKATPCVIAIRDIQWLNQVKTGNLDFVRDLKICYNSGQIITVHMSSGAAVNDAIDYVNSKRNEMNKLTEDEEIRRKYEDLKHGKNCLLRSKYIIEKRLKDVYLMSVAILMIIVISIISMTFDKRYELYESYFVDFNISVAFFVGMIGFGMWFMYSIYSFHRYSIEMLVDVGMKMIKKNRYFNYLYSMYVVDDYLVSCRFFILKIIPISEIESVQETFGITSHVLKIKTKNGKVSSYCRTLQKPINGNAIREIVEKIEEKRAC